MKLLWALATFYVLAVNANAPFDDNDTLVHGENGWYVPTLEGTFEWFEKEESDKYLEAMESVDNFKLSVNPVKFYLYTRANPSKGYRLKETINSLSGSYYDGSKPTIFNIHGWTQNYRSGMNKNIRTSWLRRLDCNVIVVDWARARSADYASSVAAVSKVGKKIASFIDFLNKYGNMSFKTLTIAGHSLGAHVAGYAGKNVKRGKVQTIVGMDPAMPMFHYDKPKSRLSSNDAVYVEIIHTNGGQLGFLQPLGNSDFYPAGGKSQPGCLLDVTGACSHGRSTTYYAEAVDQNDFGTIKCGDYKQAVARSCGTTFASSRMGAIEQSDLVTGIFYTPVHSKSLFGVLNDKSLEEVESEIDAENAAADES